MNIYAIVEGEKATKKIYRNWISYFNNKLKPIDSLIEYKENNYFLFAGHGQNEFPDKIAKAVEDVNAIESVDRLVIGIDSENLSFEEKKLEVESWIEKFKIRVEVRIVIQHFCLETWLLGNRTVFRKKPQDLDLLKYIDLFDVRTYDPELLPKNDEEGLNRAKFAYRYLRAGIRDVYGNKKWYSKSNPGIALEEGFYNQVRQRCIKSEQIKSFKSFMDAFS